MIGALFSVGFLSIMGQVVLFRELNVAFFGLELMYILAMAIWLLWSAAGAMIGPGSRLPGESAVGWAFVAFAVLLLVDVLFMCCFRHLAGAFAGTFLPFVVQLVALFVLLMPVGMLAGLLFQWSGKILVARGGRLARAYAVECVGGVVGGGGATLLFFAGLQNLVAAWICAGIAALSAVCLCVGTPRRLPTAAVGVAVMGAGFFFLPWLDAETTRWGHPDLVAMRDSPYGRLTLTRRAEQFVLYENDVISFETQSADAESLAHLAALSLVRIDDAALLGGGMEGLLHELIRHRPGAVDYVKIDPLLIGLLRRHLPKEWRSVLDRRAVRIRPDDPRRFLETAGLYGLILSGMPQPESGAANRFYTREFFQLARRHLREGGILAFRLRAGENVWSPMTAARNASVWRALRAEFAYAVALPGRSLIVLASPSPVPTDPDLLIDRLTKRGIETRLVSPPYIRYLFTNDRYAEAARILNTTEATANSDAHPVSYCYSVLIWLSKFMPSLIHLRPAAPGGAAAPVVIVLIVTAIGWGLGRTARLRGIFWMGVAGFVGMVLETMVLLHYQSAAGVLYQNMGVLIMTFMAGLWAGARTVLSIAPERQRELRIGSLLFTMAALVGGGAGGDDYHTRACRPADGCTPAVFDRRRRGGHFRRYRQRRQSR